MSLITPQYRPGRAGQTKGHIDIYVASEGRRLIVSTTHTRTHTDIPHANTHNPLHKYRNTRVHPQTTHKNTTTLTHYMPTHTLT